MGSFVIYTAGRSRTAWLSKFLTYGECRCHFEMASHWHSIPEVFRFFSKRGNGTAETAIAPGWRLLDRYIPDHRRVVIRRPIDEIVESLVSAVGGRNSFDIKTLRKTITYHRRCLDQISLLPKTLTFDFVELSREDACATLFEHCLPYKFDREWWLRWSQKNVQVDVVEFAKKLDHEQIEKFRRACRRRLIYLARAGILKRN